MANLTSENLLQFRVPSLQGRLLASQVYLSPWEEMDKHVDVSGRLERRREAFWEGAYDKAILEVYGEAVN